MTHFNTSSLPLFDDLLQALERKLRYCRRSFDCGFFEDHTSLEQQALLSGRKIEIFFFKDFLGGEKAGGAYQGQYHETNMPRGFRQIGALRQI